jgi:hypothetical protein
MITTADDPAQEFLDRIVDRKACDWCKHPDKPVHRGGLCSHCYKIKTELRRLHRRVEDRTARGTVHPMFGLGNLRFEYTVAIDMAEAAQWEGRKYGSPNKGDVTPLDLEHEFEFIGEKFLKKDLYRHSVALFQHFFTPSQRRLLMYILSKMSREYLRRNRRSLAWLDVQGGRTVEEALKERAFGTYRVEEEPTVVGNK